MSVTQTGGQQEDTCFESESEPPELQLELDDDGLTSCCTQTAEMVVRYALECESSELSES